MRMVSIAPGLMLCNLDDVHRHFLDLGFKTKRTFYKFLRAIGVPVIYAPNGSKHINIYTLAAALHCVTALGQRDFAAPGSYPAKHPSRRTHPFRTRLDNPEVQDMRDAILDLMTMHRMEASTVKELRNLRSQYGAAIDSIAANTVRALRMERSQRRRNGAVPAHVNGDAEEPIDD